ncbi:little elongation complex subunit 1 [Drosophila bipectinata]|uniref:little elongation complex subunit 1 n=1 Tax=Drosophila bipectinata TaxID=42026 RepID=UPI001C8A661F|nr:little elongation complex subunit 1 [Drosophila bipectinata]
MDFSEFSEINIDQLLNDPAPPQNEVISSYRQISTPRINGNVKAKRSQLAERIGQSDDLIRQLKQLQTQNKQLTELQKTAKEVTELYQKEKQLRLELEESSNKFAAQCLELERKFDVQVATCENLQDELQKKGLPVEAKDVLGILMQFHHRLGDDCGLTRRDSNIMKKLKEYCKSAEIPIAPPKSPNSRPKRKSLQNSVNQSTQTDQEPVKEKPVVCSVGVQVGRVVETRSQGSQYKRTTTTRSTTTACFIEKRDVSTSFPEPVITPKVREILDEMLSWSIDKVVSPLSPVSGVPEIRSAVSVATSTTLCNIQREIDYMPEVPSQIKVSASRPPSRGMMDGIKEESRYSLGNKELAKELLNFLPQNQSCLANMSPQAFDELWQVFGQMVLGLLQRRSVQQSVSNADFASWLHELYEGAGNYPEALCINQPATNTKDFAAGTDCVDVGTDPIIQSPNISYGGNVTPIRLPPQQPRERKSKQKKRKATSPVKSSSKRKCREEEILENQNNEKNDPVQDKDRNEEEPETAIQFISNLNKFNMANCDNLNMELDEEEMYLLQLTTQKSQEPEQPTCTNNPGEGTDQVPLEVNELPAIQNEDVQPLPIDPIKKPEDPKTFEACTSPATEVESPIQEVRSVGSSIVEEESRDAKTRKTLETLKILFGSDSDSDGIVKRQTNPGSHPDSKSCEEESESDAAILRLLTVRKPNSYSDFTSTSSEEMPRSVDLPKQSPEHLAAPICLSDSTSDSPESLDIFSCQSDSSLDFPKHMYVSPWLTDSISESSDRVDVRSYLDYPKSDCPETLDSRSEDKTSGGKAARDMDDIQLDKYLTSELPSSISGTTNVDIEADYAKVPEDASSILSLMKSRMKNFYSSSDESDDPRLIIDESADSRSDMEKTPSPLSVSPTPKKPLKMASNLLEVRMTRFRAKQLQTEQDQKLNEDGRTSLVDQIRDRLKKSLPSDLEGRPLESNSKAADVGLEGTLEEDQPERVRETEPKEKSKPKEDKPCPKRRCVSLDASPASPPPEPIEELSLPIDIPLEQDKCQQTNGPPLLVHHLISSRDGPVQRKLSKDAQETLSETIEKYLEDRTCIDSSFKDFKENFRKGNHNVDESVEAMITVICKVGLEAIPVSRLMVALQHFEFTERFLLGIELRLFRNKDRPQLDMAMEYIKLYLIIVSLMQEPKNPTRLLLAKILYHCDKDMPGLVFEILSQCPTVIPHREEREYDHSDPLITVIKHLLMNRKYDMNDPDSPERMLLSKLRFEYHFQKFEPTGNQVLENLVEKIKAGRLEQLGYAFALFCRRSPHVKVMDTVFGEHLLPLAASYCDLATQTEDFDDRLQTLVQCISMALKALPVETNISACVGLFKHLIVAVPRPAVQESVVQGILRLQRFGFGHVMDVLQSYRPEYALQPLTRAMLRSFAQRRRKYHYSFRKFQRD